MSRLYKQSMNHFHHSSLSFKTIMSLMASFICMFTVAFIILRIINSSLHLKLSPMLDLLAFLVLELLPLFIMVMVEGAKNHYKYTKLSIWQKCIYHVGSWIKIFLHEIKRHWKYIIVCIFIGVFLEQVVMVLLPALCNTRIVTSQNSKTISELGRQNKLFLLTTVVIAPLCEEFFFRLCCTTAFEHLIGFFGRIPVFFYHLAKGDTCNIFKLHLNKWFVIISYWLGAIFSAIIFGSLHDPMDPNILLLLDYVVLALFLQFLMHRTHSLTASVLAHSGLNLFVSLPSLLA